MGRTAYPVPHCSIRVMFSCSRLLSHDSSSCLVAKDNHVSIKVPARGLDGKAEGLLTWIRSWRGSGQVSEGDAKWKSDSR